MNEGEGVPSEPRRNASANPAGLKRRFGVGLGLAAYPATLSVFLYLVFSAIVVVGGDLLLAALVEDPDRLTRLQTIKGLVFVVLSAMILLWFGLRRDRAVRERQARDNALRESDDRYRVLFEGGTPPMILFGTESGRVVDANPAALNFYGYGLDEIRQLHSYDLSAMNEAENRSLFQRAVQGEQARFEMRHRLSDGSVRDVLCHAGPLILNGGRHVYSIVYDITSLKALNAELENRVVQKRILAELGQEGLRAGDLGALMHRAIASVAEVLNVDLVHVLRLGAARDTVALWAVHGWDEGTVVPTREVPIPLESLVETVVRTGEPVVVSNHATDTRFPPEEHLERHGVVSSIGLLIAHGSDMYGLLSVHARTPRVFAPADVSFLQTVGNILAASIRQQRTAEEVDRAHVQLVRAYDETIEGWARTLDLRDHETEGHSRRVTELAVALGRALGLNGPDLQRLRRGALLHDIGKMAVPDSILHKPGPLTAREWDVMRKHTVLGWDLLSRIEFLRDAADIPHAHHEKWDGSGYPQGLSGPEIPLAARIFCVVDVYDALTSKRPYRAAWSEERALAHIRSESGKHFDPEVALAFLEMMHVDGRAHPGS